MSLWHKAALLTPALFALTLGGHLMAQTVTTIAGGPDPSQPPSYPSAGSRNGISTNAHFNVPFSCALDSAGNLYVADRNNHAIRKMSYPGNPIGETRTLLTVTNKSPVGVAVDNMDVLYILTTEDKSLRKYSLTSKSYLSTNTFASAPLAVTVARDLTRNVYCTLTNGTICVVRPDNTTNILLTKFKKPAGIAWTPSGLLAVSDAGNNSIWWVDPANGASYWLTGQTNMSGGFTDGSSDFARFNQPYGIAASGDGSLLVADRMNHRVREVFADGYTKTLYGVSSSAWVALFPGWQDTSQGTPEAREPVSVSISPNGAVFVTEVYYNLIRYVSDSGFNSTMPAPSNPRFSPDCGYYVGPVNITVTNSVGDVYYTVNGDDPTPNDTYVPTPGGVGTIVWSDVTRDLSSLRVKAFYGTNESTTFAGEVCEPTTPKISPTSGYFPSGKVITVLNDFGAVFYTTNNTEPTINSTYVPMNNGVGYICWTNSLHDLSWLRVKAFSGVDPTNTLMQSSTVSGTTVAVTTPSFSPSCGLYLGLVDIVVSNRVGDVYYTTDGTEPTINSARLAMSSGSNVIHWNDPNHDLGWLRVKAFNGPDYFSPTVVGQSYCSPTVPTIAPNSGYYPNGVTITVSNAFGTVFYTTNGTVPTTNSFMVAMTNGVGSIQWTNSLHDLSWLRLRAINGDESSAVVSGQSIAVTTPSFSPSCGFYTNCVDVTVVNPTGDVYYTTDGTEPTLNSLHVSMINGVGIISWCDTLHDLSSLRVKAFSGPDVYSDTVGGEACLPTTPTFGPKSGYYPDTVVIWVTNEVGTVYYTTDGSEPTVNSLSVARGDNGIGSFRWTDSLHDLSYLRLKSFSGDNASPTVSGLSSPVNAVGVTHDMVAGAGSTIVVPVVVNMVAGQQLRSLQFRLEVTPSNNGSNAPAITNLIEALTLSEDNFIPVVGNSGSGYTGSIRFRPYQNGMTNGIQVDSVSTTNLLIDEFGVVANLMLKIPAAAALLQTYRISVIAPSGTSDGSQGAVSLVPMAPATLTVSNVSYVAGDASLGGWYNAGNFGDGILNNADVNAIFEASLGVHRPYPGTDAFNAMDAYPDTRLLMGDGKIDMLDWEHVLQRSLGLETNTWTRMWSNGSLTHYTSDPLPYARFAAAPVGATAPSCDIWVRQAIIGGTVMTNLQPGQTYSMPVYMKVLPGFDVYGFQFRAALVAEEGAPAGGPIQFTPTSAVPQPMPHPLPASNELACAWSLGALTAPLQNSNLIGSITFQIPAAAQAGQHYTIAILFPSGAADLNTGLEFESVAGSAWVMSAPPAMPAHVVSDDWKTNFFGSVTNLNADPEADPDHDGIPNWMEYLAGTNPTNADSRLAFTCVNRPNSAPGVALQWPAMTGRSYVVETCPAIGGTWTAIYTNVGDGTVHAFNQTNLMRGAQFYRIRLQ